MLENCVACKHFPRRSYERTLSATESSKRHLQSDSSMHGLNKKQLPGSSLSLYRPPEHMLSKGRAPHWVWVLDTSQPGVTSLLESSVVFQLGQKGTYDLVQMSVCSMMLLQVVQMAAAAPVRPMNLPTCVLLGPRASWKAPAQRRVEDSYLEVQSHHADG